jgi:hypothetical protein
VSCPSGGVSASSTPELGVVAGDFARAGTTAQMEKNKKLTAILIFIARSPSYHHRMGLPKIKRPQGIV